MHHNKQVDFSLYRTVYLEQLIGNTYFQAKEKHFQQKQIQAEEEVQALIETLDLNHTNGSLWPKLEGKAIEYTFMHSFYYLEAIGRQYANPYSSYYQDKEVLSLLLQALQFLQENSYYVGVPLIGNWWCYEIGTPQALNKIMLYLWDDMPDFMRKNFLETIDFFVPDPRYMLYRFTQKPLEHKPTETEMYRRAEGGNQVDIAMVKFIWALLAEDEEALLASWDALCSVFVVVEEGNGFYPDYSYVDHGNIAYPGGYGAVFLEGLSVLLPLAQSIGYHLTDSNRNLLYSWIEFSFLPFIYKGELMDMIRGRSATRKHMEAHLAGNEILYSILRLAYAHVFTAEKESKLQAELRQAFTDEKFVPIELKAQNFKDLYLLSTLMADATLKANEESFNRYYPAMAKWVCKNSIYNFGLGLSLHSSKIQNYEYMNLENKKGWYTSDGMLHLFTGDSSHYSNNYQCTVDPNRRPGTTVIRRPMEDGTGETTLMRNFVSGIVQGTNHAMIGMDFVNSDLSMEAKKSWFYAQDALHCLGAGINGIGAFDQKTPIETIIENRKVTDLHFDLYINGTARYLKSGEEEILEHVYSLYFSTADDNTFGVQFHKPVRLHLLLEKRQGTWYEINGMETMDPYENTFLTLWITHDDANKSYAYSLYPNRTYEEFSEILTAQSIVVLENNADVQIIEDTLNGEIGVCLYNTKPTIVMESYTLQEPGCYII